MNGRRGYVPNPVSTSHENYLLALSWNSFYFRRQATLSSVARGKDGNGISINSITQTQKYLKIWNGKNMRTDCGRSTRSWTDTLRARLSEKGMVVSMIHVYVVGCSCCIARVAYTSHSTSQISFPGWEREIPSRLFPTIRNPYIWAGTPDRREGLRMDIIVVPRSIDFLGNRTECFRRNFEKWLFQILE